MTTTPLSLPWHVGPQDPVGGGQWPIYATDAEGWDWVIAFAQDEQAARTIVTAANEREALQGALRLAAGALTAIMASWHEEESEFAPCSGERCQRANAALAAARAALEETSTP